MSHTSEVSGAPTKTHQTAGGCQLHGCRGPPQSCKTLWGGMAPLRGSFATAPPITYDGFITLGLWLNGSIIVPIACRRHIGSRPILIADCISLIAKKTLKNQ